MRGGSIYTDKVEGQRDGIINRIQSLQRYEESFDQRMNNIGVGGDERVRSVMSKLAVGRR